MNSMTTGTGTLTRALPHGQPSTSASCHANLVIYIDKQEERAILLLLTFFWSLPAHIAFFLICETHQYGMSCSSIASMDTSGLLQTLGILWARTGPLKANCEHLHAECQTASSCTVQQTTLGWITADDSLVVGALNKIAFQHLKIQQQSH